MRVAINGAGVAGPTLAWWLLERGLVGDDWRFLSIPPGGTAAYNANPTRERPPDPAGSDGDAP